MLANKIKFGYSVDHDIQHGKDECNSELETAMFCCNRFEYAQFVIENSK